MLLTYIMVLACFKCQGRHRKDKVVYFQPCKKKPAPSHMAEKSTDDDNDDSNFDDDDDKNDQKHHDF